MIMSFGVIMIINQNIAKKRNYMIHGYIKSDKNSNRVCRIKTKNYLTNDSDENETAIRIKKCAIKQKVKDYKYKY